MIHVIEKLLNGNPKGAIGNTWLTKCGAEVEEKDDRNGPFVDWAGWRATCPECVIKSLPAWQPWVKQVFGLARAQAGDLYDEMKIAYVKGKQ